MEILGLNFWVFILNVRQFYAIHGNLISLSEICVDKSKFLGTICVHSFHIKSVHLFVKTSAGVKRKHAYQTDDQGNKHIHLDQEAAASDGFADLTTLVNMSSAVSLAVSQVRSVPALPV